MRYLMGLFGLVYLLAALSAWGANVVGDQVGFIDTPASGDVTIATRGVKVKNITITAYTAAKTTTFIDGGGAVVLILECPADSTISWPPFDSGNGLEFPNGLYLDDSATDLANSSDYIFYWLDRKP